MIFYRAGMGIHHNSQILPRSHRIEWISISDSTKWFQYPKTAFQKGLMDGLTMELTISLGFVVVLELVRILILVPTVAILRKIIISFIICVMMVSFLSISEITFSFRDVSFIIIILVFIFILRFSYSLSQTVIWPPCQTLPY